VRVTSEMGQHALRSAEGRLGADDERALAKHAQALCEGGGLGERREIAKGADDTPPRQRSFRPMGKRSEVRPSVRKRSGRETASVALSRKFINQDCR